MTVRDLYPGYFALVMATGICSPGLRDIGQPTASAVLLIVALVGFVVLSVALGWRLARHPRHVLADLGAPDRTFAFFTVAAAGCVLGARVASAGYRAGAVALLAFAAVVWLVLTYTIPVRL